MKLHHSLLIAGASLVPSIAIAQDEPDPDTAPPSTTTTIQVSPTPAPPPAPTPPAPTVLVVNPVDQPVRPLASPAEPVDEGYDTYNSPMVITGGAMFVGSYGASIVTAAVSNHAGANRLYIPVAGPWLALDQWGGCPGGNASCDSNTADKVLLIADGVVQGISVITMLSGMVTTYHHHGRMYADERGFQITPTPTGVSMMGHF